MENKNFSLIKLILETLNDKRTFVNILQNALNTINSPTKKKPHQNWMKNNHFIYTFQYTKFRNLGPFIDTF